MNVMRTLLVKDLRRIMRNPTPLIILIVIPFLITALIGMAFGGMGSGDGEGFAPIRLGIVDDDDSIFSQFLSGAVGQEDLKKRIDAQFLEREEALELVSHGELSAVLIIPEGFTDEYLTGDDPIKLILIKNPAEYIYPTLAQEGSELIVSALNTIARNFRKDLHELREVIEDDRDFDLFRDILGVSSIITHAVNRLEAADAYLTPPLVSYEKEARSEEIEEDNKGPGFSLFSFLLVGMAAMFLLMIADNCMRDLYRESRLRTLERFRTLREGLFVFVASKVVYTTMVLFITAVIILGGGGLIFKFQWQHLGQVSLLVICYSVFGAGLMGFIAALAGKERRADMLNTIFIIGMSLTGGSMWPPENLPLFIQKYVTHYTPTFWFSSAIRGLQSDYAGLDWTVAAALLMGLGIVFVVGSAWLFQIRLERGIKE